MSMKPDQTGKKYDTISDRWSDVRFDRENGIDAHKRAITFVRSRGRALDVGCGGTGRIIEYLAKEGFTPDGIDVSEKMIALARIRNPEWMFLHDDICSCHLSETYDLITAWDSIWHVPLNAQAGVISKLVSALNPNGVMIFSFGGLTVPGEHTDDSMGPEMYYSSLSTNGYIQVLGNNGCMINHLEFDQYPELHAYIVAQKNA